MSVIYLKHPEGHLLPAKVAECSFALYLKLKPIFKEKNIHLMYQGNKNLIDSEKTSRPNQIYDGFIYVNDNASTIELTKKILELKVVTSIRISGILTQ